MAESNAYNYEDDPSYRDPDDPARCVLTFSYAHAGVGHARSCMVVTTFNASPDLVVTAPPPCPHHD